MYRTRCGAGRAETGRLNATAGVGEANPLLKALTQAARACTLPDSRRLCPSKVYPSQNCVKVLGDVFQARLKPCPICGKVSDAFGQNHHLPKKSDQSPTRT